MLRNYGYGFINTKAENYGVFLSNLSLSETPCSANVKRIYRHSFNYVTHQASFAEQHRLVDAV